MSTISVLCSGCGVKLKIKEEWIGRKGKCPKCATVIKFSLPEEPTAAPPAAEEEDPFKLAPLDNEPTQSAPGKIASEDPLRLSAAPTVKKEAHRRSLDDPTGLKGIKRAETGVSQTSGFLEGPDLPFGGTFTLAGQIFSRNMLVFAVMLFVLNLLNFIITAVITIAGLFGTHAIKRQMGEDEMGIAVCAAFVAVIGLIGAVFVIWFTLGYIRYVIEAVQTGKGDPRSIFRAPFTSSFRALAAILLIYVLMVAITVVPGGILMAISIAVGGETGVTLGLISMVATVACALIVPLCVLPTYGLSIFCIIDPKVNAGVFESLKMAAKISSGNRMKLLFLAIIGNIISSLSFLLLGIGGLFGASFYLCLVATAYVLLSENRVMGKYHVRTLEKQLRSGK